MVEPAIDCPCCRYISLRKGGHGEICPICYWECDHFLNGQMNEPSISNHGLTLEEARINFEKYGACEAHFVDNVLPYEVRNLYQRVKY
jgi:hypothetical protein